NFGGHHCSSRRVEVIPSSIDVVRASDRYLHSILQLIATRLNFGQALGPPVAITAHLRLGFESIAFWRRHTAVTSVNANRADAKEALTFVSRRFHYIQIHECVRVKHLGMMLHIITDSPDLGR